MHVVASLVAIMKKKAENSTKEIGIVFPVLDRQQFLYVTESFKQLLQ